MGNNPFTAPAATPPASPFKPDGSQTPQSNIVPASVNTPNGPVSSGAIGNISTRQDIADVDFDSDVKIATLERFQKLRKDEVSRVAFILFNPPKKNDFPSPKFKYIMEFSEYHGPSDPANVRFIAPSKNEGLYKACAARFGEPKPKFGTVFLHYDTDPYGNMLPNGSYKLEAFVFGADKWNLLKRIHQEWGLHQHDLTFVCTEPNFQRWTIQAVQQSYWSQAGQEMIQSILNDAESLFDNYLSQSMGRSRTDSEISQLLQGAQKPAILPTASPVNPFAPSVGTGAPAHGMFQPKSQPHTPQKPGFAPGGEVFSDMVADATQGGKASPEVSQD